MGWSAVVIRWINFIPRGPNFRTRSKMAKAVGATVFATVVAGSLFASNWPQFRGPTGLGYTDEKELPVKWSKNENVLWKSPLNGQGHASPIVWGDSIFVCTANWPS